MDKTQAHVSIYDMGELLTVAEVAAYLNVSNGTVYSMIHDGELEAIKIRNTFRINRDQLISRFGL